MKRIRNEKRPDIDYLINVNLNEIIVVARKKEKMERINKLKMRFRIVDEYNTNINDGVSYVIRETYENDERIILYIPKDFTIETMLETVNNELNIGLETEMFINDLLNDAKTVEFADDPDERVKKEDDGIIDMR